MVKGHPRECLRADHFRVTWSPQRGEIENSGGHEKKQKISLDTMTLVAATSRSMKNFPPSASGSVFSPRFPSTSQATYNLLQNRRETKTMKTDNEDSADLRSPQQSKQ
jgi:hypothetical protein